MCKSIYFGSGLITNFWRCCDILDEQAVITTFIMLFLNHYKFFVETELQVRFLSSFSLVDCSLKKALLYQFQFKWWSQRMLKRFYWFNGIVKLVCGVVITVLRILTCHVALTVYDTCMEVNIFMKMLISYFINRFKIYIML